MGLFLKLSLLIWVENCGVCGAGVNYRLLNWGIVAGKGVCDTCCVAANALSEANLAVKD